jgi:hypothetical protein
MLSLMVQLWEKLQFWKKPMSSYKLGTDYDYVDFTNSDVTGIILHLKEYENVVYHYNRARVKEEGDIARLEFGYTIVDPGKYDIDVLNSDDKLHIIMGDILTIILMSKAKDEQIRTDDSEEFDLQ